MLNKRTLDRINERPRGKSGAPLVALLALLLSLGVGLFLSLALAAVVLLAGGAVALSMHVWRTRRRVTRLEYRLEERSAARFARIGEACKSLASSGEIRHEVEPGEKIEVGLLCTPGISASLEIWGFGFAQSKLFFFPECILVYEDGLYRPVPYESLEVRFLPYLLAEEGEVPSDADVLGYTWRHVMEDGSRDERRRENPRLTEVLYGLLEVSGGGGLDIRLRVSDRNAAMRFARVLDSGAGALRVESSHQEGMAPEMAYGILGLEPGAPRTAVISAYRKLAKAHHPDLLQHLPPQERESAERRMRAVNAAYAELKRPTDQRAE